MFIKDLFMRIAAHLYISIYIAVAAQKTERVPKTNPEFKEVIREIISNTFNIKLLSLANAKKQTNSAADFLLKRRSAFVKIEQPPDIVKSLQTAFEVALAREEFSMESSIQEEGELIDNLPQLTPAEAATEHAISFFKALQSHVDSNIMSICNTVQIRFYFHLY